MALSSVRVIPTIMKAKGWHKAATLLETWFSRAKYIRAEPQRGVPPPENELRNAYNANALGGLTWIKGTTVGGETYNKIFNDKLWRSYDDKKGNAQKKLVKILKDEGILNQGANNTRFGYKNYSAIEYERTKTAVNASTYSTGDDQFDIALYGIQEMTAALGSFTLKIALNGTLTYQPPMNILGRDIGNGKYIVKPESIEIYLWDLFDFEGDQPLGHWREDPPEVSIFGFDGAVEVTNASFRNWRNSAASKGMGGDYYLYTEPVKVKLEDASEFDITAFV